MFQVDFNKYSMLHEHLQWLMYILNFFGIWKIHVFKFISNLLPYFICTRFFLLHIFSISNRIHIRLHTRIMLLCSKHHHKSNVFSLLMLFHARRFIISIMWLNVSHVSLEIPLTIVTRGMIMCPYCDDS